MKNLPRIVLTIFLGLCSWLTLSGVATLSNPSFEISGSSGMVFAGWNQFGECTVSNNAVHGTKAAKLSNTNSSSPFSGYWQQLNSAVGEQWNVSGFVKIDANQPLTGFSKAYLELQWRNSSGTLISTDNHVVAETGDTIGQYNYFDLVSQNAPDGTAYLRLQIVISQDINEPTAQVLFDQISCYSTNQPTINDIQWNDFPGGRTIQFSNRDWRVKGTGHYGPGPNSFSDSEQSVWIDTQDRLHMTIRQISGAWYSSEITLVDTLGYGDYIFTTQGALDQLDLRTVLGLFLWQYNIYWDPPESWWNPYNEFDIEYSRWGNPGNQIGQFVAQPWDWQGNMYRYDASFTQNEIASHAFRWLPDRIECRAWRGGPTVEASSAQISSWTYTGPHIPRPEQPRVHINLWYFGAPPSSTQEVILNGFTFIPMGGELASYDDTMPIPDCMLRQNYPNPFNPKTNVSFDLKYPQSISIEIYDLKGRKLQTITHGYWSAGSHGIEWNAENLPSAVYFIKLITDQGSQTKKCVLLK